MRLTRNVLVASVRRQQVWVWRAGRGSGATCQVSGGKCQVSGGTGWRSGGLTHRPRALVLDFPGVTGRTTQGGLGSLRYGAWPNRGYALWRRYRASTSRFGIGQQSGSNRTPLGLHQVQEKVGAGQMIGTVFESRRPVGLTWQGRPDGAIAHRILWLAGLEPGWNQGGTVDSHARYIYIHGLADEPSLGRPASRGCIHLAAADLMPLFDRIPTGTLVWIEE